MMIGGFSPDSRNRKRHKFTIPRIYPSNVDMQLTQQKCGWDPRFILVTHLHAKICLIGFEEFYFWYYTQGQINLNTLQINQKIQYFFEQSILFSHIAYFSPQISCN